MSTLSYLGNINIAVRIVQSQYPDAVLYEVDGSTPGGGPTTKPQDITQLRCIFRNSDVSTVMIYSASSWGDWKKPVFIDEPWMEDNVIPWPVQLDLAGAHSLMTAAGYTDPFKNVTLRWPVANPMPREPSYIFGLSDGEFIFVGLYTHDVHPGQ